MRAESRNLCTSALNFASRSGIACPCFRKCFAKLLHDPFRGRPPSDCFVPASILWLSRLPEFFSVLLRAEFMGGVGRSHRWNQRIELIWGSLETSQPPPNALISRTLASMRRRRMSTSFRSFCSAIVSAETT
jgi:hypothetical protein